MELPVSEKFKNFCDTLDNFLVSVVIFYCQSEVIVFYFYYELNAVRFENFETKSRKTVYFVSFRQSSNVFMQNDCGFKTKYQWRKKFIF